MRQTKGYGIYEGMIGRKKGLCTENLTPGVTFFNENTAVQDGKEYRELDPRRSKLAAAVAKGLQETGISQGSTVLYLGASHGYTPSFISDIVGSNGFVFAIDFAPRVVRDLVYLTEKRENMAPILADCNKPESYYHLVLAADVIYQDIAQKNQTEIFLKNINLFLKRGGYALLAVKSRSIDVTRNPRDIFREVRKELEQSLRVLDFRILDPFERDHCFFVCQRK